MLFLLLQVQVQRSETERQVEQRVNSYAHISQQEADEKWKQLSCASADSHLATTLWNKLLDLPSEDVKLSNMARSDYLSALTPGVQQDSNLPCMLCMLLCLVSQ